MTIIGSVDLISTTGAVGWILDRDAPAPMAVQARLQGRVIGEAVADHYRGDLAVAGFGDGHHGFEIPFYEDVDPAVLPAVSIHPADADVMLPRTNLAGLHEFLAAVIGRFPAAGRSRSIHGGLWVDRTDAQRLLRGRIAADATPAELELPLRDFIADGAVKLGEWQILEGRAAAEAIPLEGITPGAALDPEADAAAEAILEALPDLLYQDAPLQLLRALLDDNPVAIRAVLHRGTAGAFAQPSTAEALPSPAECVLAVIGLGAGGCTLDVVRGSHTLPEFNAAGQSRWTTPGAAVGIELAVAHGASVDSIEVGPGEIALVSAGSLYRIGSGEDGAGLAAWCVPTRQSPLRVLTEGGGRFSVRHASGALVVA